MAGLGGAWSGRGGSGASATITGPWFCVGGPVHTGECTHGMQRACGHLRAHGKHGGTRQGLGMGV